MNKQLKIRKFKSSLDAAISYLIGMGIIEKEAEIVEELGVSKGNLSTFKTSGKFGEGFKTKFQDAYGINLSDFNPETYNPKQFMLNSVQAEIVLSQPKTVTNEGKIALERSIENLTQNELRTTAIIERLMDLIDKRYNERGGINIGVDQMPGESGSVENSTNKTTK